MSDVLVVTNVVDIQFVDEHQEALDKVEKLAEAKRFWEARQAAAIAKVAAISAELTKSSMRVRRGLVRYKPALDGILPNPILDTNSDRSTPDEITVRWNDAAVAHRPV